MRLPLGTYALTDGIWDYNLVKSAVEPFGGEPCKHEVIYRISIKGSLPHSTSLCLFEETEREDGIEYKVIKMLVSLGGIAVHSRETGYAFRDLRIVPKSSYKQWAQSLSAQQLQPA